MRVAWPADRRASKGTLMNFNVNGADYETFDEALVALRTSRDAQRQEIADAAAANAAEAEAAAAVAVAEAAVVPAEE